MQVTIETKHLLALLHFAGKGDIRTYLNAVRIEARERETVLVASTGGRIAAILSPARIEEGPEAFDVLVPRAVVEALKKAGPAIQLQSPDGVLWTATDTQTGSTHRWKDEGLRYPDWRRVVPRTTSGQAGHYNAEDLEAVAKVAAALRVKPTKGSSKDKLGAAYLIAPNGNDGALVQIRGTPEFIGVLMPYRLEAVHAELRTSAPGWATGMAPAPEPECDLA